jgi:predicted RND superfamily exporter protein
LIFGIQIISRFKFELKTNDKKESMRKTISSTLFPMITTTFATLIGFQVMKLENLKSWDSLEQ